MRPRTSDRALCSLFLAASIGLVSSGCVSGHAIAPRELTDLRTFAPDAIAWYAPQAEGDGDRLARWRAVVGPPLVATHTQSPLPRAADITVVSWNVANGAGDVPRFVRGLPRGAPLVLLLQEVYRGGIGLPLDPPSGVLFAERLGGAGSTPHARAVDVLARDLGLNVYYVPSMRNGGLASDEDRGNAILTNLPLTELTAVELPFERQRRVAVAATIQTVDAAGVRRRVRVASVHLDNLAGLKRAWLGGEYGRTRQARAIRDLLATDDTAIVGGDFNTWFGFSEPAYTETARAFPQTTVSDARATFLGLLRLDHLFFRLPPGSRAAFRRADSRFGSDHFPLVGTVHLR